MEFIRKLLYGSNTAFSTETDDDFDFIGMEASNIDELPELHLSSEEIESLLSESPNPDESNSQLKNDSSLTLYDFNTNNIQKTYNTEAIVSQNDDDLAENLYFFGIMDNVESLAPHKEASNKGDIDSNILDSNSMIYSPTKMPHKLPEDNKNIDSTCSEAVLLDYDPQQMEKEILDYDSNISLILSMKNRLHKMTNAEIISINSSKPSSPINSEEHDIISISSDDEIFMNKEPNTIESKEKKILADTTEHSLLKTEKIEMIGISKGTYSFVKYDFEMEMANLDDKEGLGSIIKDPYDSDTYNGYNSSDFEFITESDAEFDAPLKQFKHNIIFPVRNDNDPDPSIYKDDTTVKKCVARMVDVRENHEQPDEDQFLYIFGGPPVPAYSFETDFKSLYSYHPTPMNIEYEGVGFDMAQQHIFDEDDEAAQHEAENVRILILAEQLDENNNLEQDDNP